MAQRICVEEGCSAWASRGPLCWGHAQELAPFRRRDLEPADRVWQHIRRIGGCWEWTGPVIRTSGYGQFKSTVAHRFVYELLVEPIPPKMQLDHLCRNRLCVFPPHLEVVTSRENTMRSSSWAAENARRTQCHRGHAFDGANTYVDPRGHRRCRECDRVRQRERYHRGSA